MKIAVLGSGGWGTALALVLLENGHDVTLWSYTEEESAVLRQTGENPMLKGVALPKELKLTSDLACVKGCGAVVLATPSFAVRTTAKAAASLLEPGAVLVSVSKGIEKDTSLTLTDAIEQEVGDAHPIVALSGPSHAEEVGRKLPTTCVIGAKTQKTAEYLQSMFISKVFRVYTSPDILGIELGGSLKNVIALAAGIADGLGYGDNTKAALITRGIAEIARLGVKMGGKIESFTGLTGIGDLIVTCASVHSRNRKAGYLIGKGMSMQEAMDEVKMVVEGVYSAKAAARLAEKYQVSMPIVEEVNAVLFEGKSPAEAVDDLMMRDPRSENRALTWEN